MILLICTWNWAFMEEWKRTAGKGAGWGATIILHRLLYFHNRWRPKSIESNFEELHSPTPHHHKTTPATKHTHDKPHVTGNHTTTNHTHHTHVNHTHDKPHSLQATPTTNHTHYKPRARTNHTHDKAHPQTTLTKTTPTTKPHPSQTTPTTPQ